MDDADISLRKVVEVRPEVARDKNGSHTSVRGDGFASFGNHLVPEAATAKHRLMFPLPPIPPRPLSLPIPLFLLPIPSLPPFHPRHRPHHLVPSLEPIFIPLPVPLLRPIPSSPVVAIPLACGSEGDLVPLAYFLSALDRLLVDTLSFRQGFGSVGRDVRFEVTASEPA